MNGYLGFPHREEGFVDDLSPIFAGAVHDELALPGMLGANVLLIGLDHATRNLIETKLLPVKGPVFTWEPGERLALPAAANTGTIVLYEVSSLAHDDQVQLLDWMEKAVGQTRLVCTTSVPLLPFVEAGAFIHRLYYRLNTVSVNVTASGRITTVRLPV